MTLFRTILSHTHGCPGGTPRVFTGNEGDLLQQCPGCRALALAPAVTDTTTTTEASEASPPAPIPPRFVCAEHGNPVSWNGRGCPRCHPERPGVTR